MGINTQTTKLKKDIIDLVNNSNLPAVNVLYVFTDVMQEVQKIYQQSLDEEAKVESEKE